MTFAIVARCAATGAFGVAVASSSPAVAARCAYAEAGVGAATSQNVTDPRLGPRALRLMRDGAGAAEAAAIIARTAEHGAYRQVLAVDATGGTGIFSGAKSLGIHAEARGENVACAGNLLANEGVPGAMVAAFLSAGGALGDRIVAAMRAALAAGGEAGPVRSAGMKIVTDVPWPVADLRVDWTEGCPVTELAALWERWKPEMEAYRTRALNPGEAPSYGVPGDE
ncbi:MAG: DUF1028 domain-containing protein [Pikeienuella sp.]|uniref:DUF1028 domain-containing protein n=1 Tax=Pikeienuella sp. TaxID=2831957 RepID=UPI00391C4582